MKKVIGYLGNLPLVVLLVVGLADLGSAEPLRVVTTLSTYASITESIGGERVSVSAVAAPRFNPHFIEPRPSDVLKVKRCDLFIHSGLDLEAWRDALLNAVARSELRIGGARQLDLSLTIPLLEVPTGATSRAEGDIHLYGNPHYWLDPRNGIRIAEAIATKLSEMDPEGAPSYQMRKRQFSEALNKKMVEWQSDVAPFKGRELIGYHNEWAYLMQYLGLKMELFIEPKPGVPPSPKSIEYVIKEIANRKVAAVAQSTYFDTEAGESISVKTGVPLLVLAQSVGEIASASDYIALIDYNVELLVKHLEKQRD